jgi:hypothetical protein
MKTNITDIPGMVLALHGELDAASVRSMSQASRSLLHLANETGIRDTSRGGRNKRRAQSTRADPANFMNMVNRLSRIEEGIYTDDIALPIKNDTPAPSEANMNISFLYTTCI